ncbi:hypothetical protein BESB_039180 [Besnoitia besnoiti]|uniref:Transmembrane protein n=1 Tax=Besnoitia besnoiti TaxID=94643 RepID=A0A2A9MNX9_BESBE|nr:hypothetical protein BESB_039180 [Besnoitia besnoiti]PFH37460.1 hypothetical protein BESB_039180 [Besnoitia besnoiti]
MSLSFAGASVLNLTVVFLIALALGARSPKLCRVSAAVVVAQGLYSAFFLVGMWSIFDGPTRQDAQRHNAGMNPDLWFAALFAWPAAVILASLANTQSAGSTGFEGPQRITVPAPEKSREGTCSAGWSRVGTWTVGVSLGQGVLLWSGVCFVMAAVNLRSFWDLHMIRFYSSRQLSWVFMLEGLVLCFLAAAAFVGTVLSSTFALLISLFCSITVGPLALVVVVWWNVLLSRGKIGVEDFITNQFSVMEQYVCIICFWFACRALCGLIAAKAKGRSGFESPADELPEIAPLISAEGTA